VEGERRDADIDLHHRVANLNSHKMRLFIVKKIGH
jgi:hypothetical protein